MEPQPDSLFCCLELFFIRHADTKDDSCEVSQVEQVMGFGWSGQELFHGTFVDFQCRLEDFGLGFEDVCIEAESCKMPFQDGRKDSAESLVFEAGKRRESEMSQDSGGDKRPTTTWRAHGADKNGVDNVSEWFFLIFVLIPSSLIQELSD